MIRITFKLRSYHTLRQFAIHFVSEIDKRSLECLMHAKLPRYSAMFLRRKNLIRKFYVETNAPDCIEPDPLIVLKIFSEPGHENIQAPAEKIVVFAP